MAIIENILYASVTISLFYYTVVFYRLYFFDDSPKLNNNQLIPVSVIVCAKNAAELLQQQIPLILQQQYPKFELLIVNDASEDGKELLLNEWMKKDKRLKVIHLSQNDKKYPGKKGALMHGIEKAIYSNLLLTDADCLPVSDHWISGMAAHFVQHQPLILGVGPYRKRKGLLNALVRYETAQTAWQYLSYALWKMPYMGVGRNLAYTKEVFVLAGGFEKHKNIASGDDDLLVQSASKFSNPIVCIDKNTFMESDAPAEWKQWWRQKTRHYTTGQQYDVFHRLFLGGYLLSKLGFYGSVAILLFMKNTHISIWAVVAANFFLITFSHMLLNRKVNIAPSWYWTPLLDVLYVLATLFPGAYSTFFSPKHWN